MPGSVTGHETLHSAAARNTTRSAGSPEAAWETGWSRFSRRQSPSWRGVYTGRVAVVWAWLPPPSTVPGNTVVHNGDLGMAIPGSTPSSGGSSSLPATARREPRGVWPRPGRGPRRRPGPPNTSSPSPPRPRPRTAVGRLHRDAAAPTATLTVDPRGVAYKDGSAKVSGTYSCTNADDYGSDIEGTLSRKVGLMTINGFFFVSPPIATERCTPGRPWRSPTPACSPVARRPTSR